MKRLTFLLALLLPAAALFGCDTESDTPAAELIVGTWAVTSANVDIRLNENLPATSVPVIDANDQAAVTFDAQQRYELTVTGPIVATALGESIELLPAGQEVTATGTYEISEDGDVRFSPAEAPEAEGAASYRFSGDDRINFSVENTEEGRALIVALLGDAPEVDLIVEAIAGGSATLQRAE